MIGENVVSGFDERMVLSIGRQVLGGNPISASARLPSIRRRRFARNENLRGKAVARKFRKSDRREVTHQKVETRAEPALAAR